MSNPYYSNESTITQSNGGRVDEYVLKIALRRKNSFTKIELVELEMFEENANHRLTETRLSTSHP